MNKPLVRTNGAYARVTRAGAVQLNPPNAYWEPGSESLLAESHGAASVITHLVMAGRLTVNELAGEFLRLVEADVAAGYVGWDMPDLQYLCDNTDANSYGLEILGCDMSDEGMELWNNVYERVDELLTGR
jgi:hypothetical protein